jgi:hypothetical protein
VAITLRRGRPADLHLHLAAEAFAFVDLLRLGLIALNLRCHGNFSSEDYQRPFYLRPATAEMTG